MLMVKFLLQRNFRDLGKFAIFVVPTIYDSKNQLFHPRRWPRISWFITQCHSIFLLHVDSSSPCNPCTSIHGKSGTRFWHCWSRARIVVGGRCVDFQWFPSHEQAYNNFKWNFTHHHSFHSIPSPSNYLWWTGSTFGAIGSKQLDDSQCIFLDF